MVQLARDEQGARFACTLETDDSHHAAPFENFDAVCSGSLVEVLDVSTSLADNIPDALLAQRHFHGGILELPACRSDALCGVADDAYGAHVLVDDDALEPVGVRHSSHILAARAKHECDALAGNGELDTQTFGNVLLHARDIVFEALAHAQPALRACLPIKHVLEQDASLVERLLICGFDLKSRPRDAYSSHAIDFADRRVRDALERLHVSYHGRRDRDGGYDRGNRWWCRLGISAVSTPTVPSVAFSARGSSTGDPSCC
mmetsp:Transcript_170/g.529  ORF Transcript_170/g.529 Transcript_170/m.529 type:complete len:260 (+) Transcript_170:319-1098(+)